MRAEGRIVAPTLLLRIDCQGRKDLLGIGLGEQESRKFWLKILTDLQNRGVKDLLIACTNGLAGFTEALKSAFPKTTPQPCVVHQIRNSRQYVAAKNQKEFRQDLKKI